MIPLLLSLLTAASPVDVRLGAGADLWTSTSGYYWHSRRGYVSDGYLTGLFNVTIAVDVKLNTKIALGGRSGLLLVASPLTPGVPVDFVARFTPVPELYLDALAGPWAFLRPWPLRFHGGVGVGYNGKVFQIGAEAAFLDPAFLFGIRLGFVL